MKQANPAISVEEAARRVLQREMGRAVVLHDDGSRPRMYDLRVGPKVSPTIAIECVAAVDSERTETWNIGPAKGSLSLALRGDWYVELRPSTNVRRLREQIEPVLRACEQAAITDFQRVDAFLQHRHKEIFEALSRLSVAAVSCLRIDGSGEVHLGMTGFGGPVDPTGAALPDWIGEFLRASTRADVRSKLRDSGAIECHVFVPVSLGGVPWLVESYLGTTTDQLPRVAPELPDPINAVWIMYGARGVRWDGMLWKFFDATIPARVNSLPPLESQS